MKEEYQIGDRILVKNIWGVFHAHIILISKGWLGKKYYCRWTVNDEFYGRYEKVGIIRWWNVIAKN